MLLQKSLSAKSDIIQFYEMNISQAMNFRLYIIYNKHETTETGNKNQRKITIIIASARIILLPTVKYINQ